MITYINNTRAREDYLTFADNVELTASELDAIISKCPPKTFKWNRFINILSKKKSEGYVPEKSDFEEILKIIHEDEPEA